MPPDDVRGYDVRTGKLLWTFHVVPRNGEPGNDTWLERLVDLLRQQRRVVAAERRRGARLRLPAPRRSDRRLLRRHAAGQQPLRRVASCAWMREPASACGTSRRIHHGIWDYDLPAAPVLGDITVNGRRIKAVAQVSKQAFVYVFNRETGEPVWPIEERPVPQGNVPGEWYSPTQPFPTKPPAFDQQGVTDNDLIDFTPELKAEAKKILSEYEAGRSTRRPSCSATPRPKGLAARARHERRRRLGRRGVRPGDQHSLRAVGAHADRDRARASRSTPSRRCRT